MILTFLKYCVFKIDSKLPKSIRKSGSMSEIRHEKHKKLGPLHSTKSHNKINQIGLQSISPSKTVHQISASNFTKPHDK